MTCAAAPGRARRSPPRSTASRARTPRAARRAEPLAQQRVRHPCRQAYARASVTRGVHGRRRRGHGRLSRSPCPRRYAPRPSMAPRWSTTRTVSCAGCIRRACRSGRSPRSWGAPRTPCPSVDARWACPRARASALGRRQRMSCCGRLRRPACPRGRWRAGSLGTPSRSGAGGARCAGRRPVRAPTRRRRTMRSAHAGRAISTCNQLAGALGRSPGSIRLRAEKLGLHSLPVGGAGVPTRTPPYATGTSLG